MSGRGSAGRAARRCAAALSIACAFPVAAQTPAPAPPPANPPPDASQLDPSEPLDPLPGLGVEWPTLDTTEPAPPDQAVQSPAPTQDQSGNRKYSVQIDGLGSAGDSEDLLKAFRLQSALEADRKDPANAAQIARRSRADADLVEELLRSQGYYDADVEARTEPAGNMVRVVLEASPGEQYRFASVELPGLDAAGP